MGEEAPGAGRDGPTTGGPAGSRGRACNRPAGTRQPADDRPAGPREPVGFGRLSVRGWIRLVLGTMAALLLLCASVGAVLLGRTNSRNTELVDHIQPGRSATLQLQKALLDQESGVRGFALSGDEAFLAPYEEGVRDERLHRAEVARLLGAGGRLGGDLAAVTHKAARWRQEQADPLIAAIRAGASVDSVQPRVEASKRRFDELRELLHAQERHLVQARDEARDEMMALRVLRDWVFLGMLAVIVATGSLLALLLNRMVVSPLSALRAAADQVAGGEFDRRIEVPGPADVRSVGRSVDSMRRRIAGELTEARARERELARQAVDLDAQAAELRRSNAELEQFAYVASHDLQEPLRKVASFCQLLEKRYGDVVDARGKQYIGFAVDGAKRMQILISDLLTFSRVGRLDDAPVRVAMDDVLAEARRNLAVAVAEAQAGIEVRSRPLPVVVGDPASLVMLWQNLLGNAVKFRHPERPVRVVVDCERDGGLWHFSVRDNGIGVPGEFAEKVFVIFQRLHSRDEYPGTGIGLALCRKIVEYYGGTIRLDTGVPEGARVCFSLPVAEHAAPSGDTVGTTGANA
ncbi:sensor histidine kinase [Streptomyces candidus]|uniref:histidine kinase n=1 Tax=Streptomyces candidus TaxID=67283 RepID=A0A7X0HAP4_9ACTN|nr:sensor histidine kinase [Streptomyces candidus]MBB6434060.1 signal transduction histidine kinase [Streptomyces candidus]GHH33483.1 histidine kinase [Streptomyces candidus]